MSVRVLNRVWEESQQKGANLLVLVAMADVADHQGLCFPGTEFLACRCRISPRHVQRILGELVESGEVEIVKKARAQTKVIYKILTALPTSEREDILSSLFDLEGGQNQPRGGTNPDSTLIKVHVRTHSPHAELISLWTESYSQHFSCSYAFQSGKDGTAVKSLLASSKLSPEELMTIARAAWSNPTGFYCKSASSITGFFSKFNEIRQELNNGKTGKGTRRESGRNIGTANEGRSSQYEGVGKLQRLRNVQGSTVGADEK